MTAAPSQFVFRAMTPQGSTRFGLRSADTENQLADSLKRDDLLLLRAWKLPVGVPKTSSLPVGDEVNFNQQLAVLLDRGVPLVDALEVCASVVKPANQSRVNKIREMVAAGTSFADACQRLGGFDDVTINVYRAAERTGDLATASRRVAQSAKRRQVIGRKTITVMIYPAVVACLAFFIFFGLLTFLVPMIARQIGQMGGEINGYSRIVFSLGNWMSAHLGVVVIIMIIVVVVILLGRHVVMRMLQSMLRRIPAVAHLLLTVQTARFFSVMGAMTKSGVPLAEALSTASNVISHPRLREQLFKLRKDLVEGGVLKNLLEKVDALPLATRRLLIAAERGGDLDTAFDALADDLAEEVDTRASRLLALLEPLMLVLIFSVIGSVIIAIVIPLMSLRSGGILGR